MLNCRPPHFSSGRMLQEGQLIHESAIEYLRRNPSPAVASVWVELWVLMGYALLNVCYVTVAAPWVGECSLLGAIFLVIHILYGMYNINEHSWAPVTPRAIQQYVTHQCIL